MDQWFWACVQRDNDIIMAVKVRTSKTDGYSVHYNFMETTISMPSFNPRKLPTTQMLAREFKTSRIIRKSKNREIKVTWKFPNLQYQEFKYWQTIGDSVTCHLSTHHQYHVVFGLYMNMGHFSMRQLRQDFLWFIFKRYPINDTLIQLSTIFYRKIVIIFLPINSNICFGCSKEPSHSDSSFEYLQLIFWLRNKKTHFQLHTLIWRPDDIQFCYCKWNIVQVW